MELVWTPYSDRKPSLMTHTLGGVLAGWKGTPYRSGQQCKGYGVDCVRFVCAVLDELEGKSRGFKTLPPDAALHAPEVARLVMRRIMRTFWPWDSVLDGTAEPGDVLVAGPRHGGPGHAIIVGPTRNTLWEATYPRVRQTGWGLQGSIHNKLFRVLRMRNRSERWANRAAIS